MFSIVITEKGGAQRQLDIESQEVSIGRLEDNDICLPKSNVSKNHARLVFKDDRYVLLDHKSTNGTYVNGRRISAPMVVRKGDKIYIGDFILTLASPGGTFEGVSAREFRPRRSTGESLVPTAMDSATDPPKAASNTRDEMPRPSHFPENAPLSSLLPDSQPAAASAALSDAPNDGAGVVHAAAIAPPPPHSQPPTANARTSAAATPLAASLPAPSTPAPSKPPPPPRAQSVTARGSSPPALPSALASVRVTVPPPKAARSKAPAEAKQSAQPRASAQPAAGNGIEAAPLQNGLTSPAVLAPSLRLQGALAMLMERLATEMNVARPEESAFPSEQLAKLEHLMDELAHEGSIGPDLDRRFLREAAVSEAVGLGPLDRLLANRSVREVVVDGPTRILADLGGGLSPVSSFFSDDSAVMVVARRLLNRAGRKLDENVAVHEARLPSGGFLQLILPPLSPKGPLVTVRCPPRAQSAPESLVTEGVLSTEMLQFLRGAVQQRKNILVLGAMGSGVSSLLGMLTMLAPDHERIVTIENAPSGTLLNAQTLPLSRHAKPELSLQEFLRYASRLRHDRLVLDDIGAPDALAALSAAAANPGIILGMHAPTPETALLQLELFAQTALGGTRTSLQPLLASALAILVHVSSTAEGTRRIQSIHELTPGKGGALELAPRFRLDGKSFTKL